MSKAEPTTDELLTAFFVLKWAMGEDARVSAQGYAEIKAVARAIAAVIVEREHSL